MLEFLSANLPIILCFLFGAGLLIAEVFMPGFGLPGISGIVLEIAAIVLMYRRYGGLAALGAGVVIMALTGILVAVALRSASRGRLSKSAVVLTESETPDRGYIAAGDMADFLGKEGITTTALRPTGMAEFQGVKLNVVSDGEFIPKNTRVKVEIAEGSRVVVRRSSGGK